MRIGLQVNLGLKSSAFCLLLGCASIVRTPRTLTRWIFRLTTTKN
jgi:hypothetical protein